MSGAEPDQRFIDALFGEDELGVVVRAHIHIEAGVNALLDVAVPHPSKLPRLRYEQRLRLICSLGLEERWFEPLKIMGDIRNTFGHKLDTKLTDSMVNGLFNAISEQDRCEFAKGLEVALNVLNMQTIEQYHTLKPKDRFILLAVGLDKMLAQAKQAFVVSRK